MHQNCSAEVQRGLSSSLQMSHFLLQPIFGEKIQIFPKSSKMLPFQRCFSSSRIHSWSQHHHCRDSMEGSVSGSLSSQVCKPCCFLRCSLFEIFSWLLAKRLDFHWTRSSVGHGQRLCRSSFYSNQWRLGLHQNVDQLSRISWGCSIFQPISRWNLLWTLLLWCW